MQHCQLPAQKLTWQHGLFIYRAFCWKNSVQPTRAPTKMTDTNPILVIKGCQYNHLFLFRSVSFSLCFICCTFCAVVAFLSSRMRFRRTLRTEKNKWKAVCVCSRICTNTEVRAQTPSPMLPHGIFHLTVTLEFKRENASHSKLAQGCTLYNSATSPGTVSH